MKLLFQPLKKHQTLGQDWTHRVWHRMSSSFKNALPFNTGCPTRPRYFNARRLGHWNEKLLPGQVHHANEHSLCQSVVHYSNNAEAQKKKTSRKLRAFRPGVHISTTEAFLQRTLYLWMGPFTWSGYQVFPIVRQISAVAQKAWKTAPQFTREVRSPQVDDIVCCVQFKWSLLIHRLAWPVRWKLSSLWTGWTAFKLDRWGLTGGN